MSIDEQITNAFGLLSVLLVFVIGYLAAALPVVESLLSVKPKETQERLQWKARLRPYLAMVIGLSLLNLLVLAALASLSAQALSGWFGTDPNRFSLPRNGLVLIDVYLTATLIGGVWLGIRLGGAIGES